MSTLSIEKSQKTKCAVSDKVSAKSNAASQGKIRSAAANAKISPKALQEAGEPKIERVTKQERVLTMLKSTRRSLHRRNHAGDGLAAT